MANENYGAGVPTGLVVLTTSQPGNVWVPGRIWSQITPVLIDLTNVANNLKPWNQVDGVVDSQNLPVNFIQFASSGKNNPVHVSLDRPTMFMDQAVGFAPMGHFVVPANSATQTFRFPATRRLKVFANISPVTFAVMDMVWIRFGYLPEPTDRAIDDLHDATVDDSAFDQDPDGMA